MIKRVNSNHTFLKLLFYLIIIEIVIGGSGRMVEFGALSLKMVLFGIAIFISFISFKEIYEKTVLRIQFFFIALLVTGCTVAAFNGAEVANIFEDIKPLLFIFMINYFVINIKSPKEIEVVSRLIKWSSLLMAITYLFFVVLLYLRIIDFDIFYQQQSESGELIFRNEYAFFYKGFIYLGIGFFFFILSDKKRDKIFALILFTALCLTFTRGLILAAGIVYLYYIFFINKMIYVKLATITIVLAAVFYLVPIMSETLGDKIDSDMIRITNIYQVLDQVNYFSFFFGHGFGTGVAIRPVHMEISYLEIFHKQGILGLVFWIALFFLILRKYLKLKQFKVIALPYVLSVCVVYLQSFTNPFVNNPIGISIIIITIVILIRLESHEKTITPN